MPHVEKFFPISYNTHRLKLSHKNPKHRHGQPIAFFPPLAQLALPQRIVGTPTAGQALWQLFAKPFWPAPSLSLQSSQPSWPFSQLGARHQRWPCVLKWFCRRPASSSSAQRNLHLLQLVSSLPSWALRIGSSSFVFFSFEALNHLQRDSPSRLATLFAHPPPMPAAHRTS